MESSIPRNHMHLNFQENPSTITISFQAKDPL